MYSESERSTAEIREQFGIGESTLYRVLQKNGVSLRGRATPSVDGTVGSTMTARKPRGRPRRDPSAGSSPQAPTARAATQNGFEREFRVRFQGQRVFDAVDVRDALRQAEAALGEVEIVEVTRVA
jgi:hypothetical protein